MQGLLVEYWLFDNQFIMTCFVIGITVFGFEYPCFGKTTFLLVTNDS